MPSVAYCQDFEFLVLGILLSVRLASFIIRELDPTKSDPCPAVLWPATVRVVTVWNIMLKHLLRLPPSERSMSIECRALRHEQNTKGKIKSIYMYVFRPCHKASTRSVIQHIVQHNQTVMGLSFLIGDSWELF
jgi:hypothetical protein